MAVTQYTSSAFKSLKVGAKYEVIGKHAGHGFVIGTKVTLVSKPPTNSQNSLYHFTDDTGYSGNLYRDDFRWASPSIEDYKGLLADAKKEVTRLESILEICAEMGVEEVDDDLIKVYGVLKTLKTEKPTIEMAKAITQIIQQ
jgi:hypothetical protein